ncbi:putative bifunctional diguanylate cyclase/phosphodiesterase [Bacillus rubiinfantis]|uniref:putative bifunctional diguanylate cyclase/phosphodiesterase n=1 Tax=Bacillus rubiinfantis TaxID=1499680 RepID=UPI0006938BB3|nr:bifunctional diguanylate cyclase/phosphodiesterase [Bacillus rubiinfantis]
MIIENLTQSTSASPEKWLQHDALTGLLNRRGFILMLEEKIQEASKLEKHFALVWIDCDRFKLINDSFGQYFGDDVLKAVAEQLLTCLTNKNEAAARMSGDEFIVLLDEVQTLQALDERIQQIRDIFQQPWSIQGIEFYLTASFGVVQYPKDGVRVEELITKAETANKQAKSLGRNHLSFFHYYTEPAKHNPVIFERELRYALEREQLLIYYQPQVNIRSGQVYGAEALLRWNHPQYGLIPPVEFVPLLDETRMIINVGEWLLEQACFQQVKWLKQGLPSITVSVNISPTQFISGTLLSAVKRAIHKSGIDPRFLKLEITENMIIKNMIETRAILEKLKRMGIGVSIDDFGTGYSSLSYLKKFPIDTIKLDRSFIKDITIDIHDQAIVKAIIDMGHTLELSLVAEGAETAQQIFSLVDAGCVNVQGFYFSPPVNATQFSINYQCWRRLAENLSEKTFSYYSTKR